MGGIVIVVGNKNEMNNEERRFVKSLRNVKLSMMSGKNNLIQGGG